MISARRCELGLEATVFGFFKLPTAGLLFFVSAWLLMLFAGAVSGDVGIRPFGYATAMVCTIAIWLVMVPAVTAVAGRRWTKASRWKFWT
jgi:hypothetical protein